MQDPLTHPGDADELYVVTVSAFTDQTESVSMHFRAGNSTDEMTPPSAKTCCSICSGKKEPMQTYEVFSGYRAPYDANDANSSYNYVLSYDPMRTNLPLDGQCGMFSLHYWNEPQLHGWFCKFYGNVATEEIDEESAQDSPTLLFVHKLGTTVGSGSDGSGDSGSGNSVGW